MGSDKRIASLGLYLALAFAGAMTVFAAPPFHLGPGLILGLVPLFAALDRAPSWRAAVWRGWVYSFFASCGIYSWVAPAVREFTHLPWAVSVLAVPLLASFQHASWALFAGLRFLVHQRWGRRPLLWSPIAFVAIEAAFPQIFPVAMGTAFYAHPIWRQGADLFAVWGLSALIIVGAEAGAAWVGEIGGGGGNGRIARLLGPAWPRRQALVHTGAALVLLVGSFVYGAWRWRQIHAPENRPQRLVKVAMIQPNIASGLKVYAEMGDWKGAIDRVLGTYFRLTEQALGSGPELVIWPETAFPRPYHALNPAMDTPSVTLQMDDFLQRGRVPILLGAYDSDGDNKYNSALLAYPRATLLGTPAIERYYKSILLQPAERVPLLQSLPGAKQWLRGHGHGAFTPGDGPKFFDVAGARLGPSICLEALYPRYQRRYAEEGAQLLVNLTNDSWFGQTREPELHLQMAMFRAIETRRPFVRATNTGHSAWIDIDGSMPMRTALGVEAAVAAQIPVYSSELRSPYVRMGDWGWGALAGAAAALTGWAGWSSRRRRAQKT